MFVLVVTGFWVERAVVAQVVTHAAPLIIMNLFCDIHDKLVWTLPLELGERHGPGDLEVASGRESAVHGLYPSNCVLQMVKVEFWFHRSNELSLYYELQTKTC